MRLDPRISSLLIPDLRSAPGPAMAALAVICFICSVVVWWLTGRWAWLAGGALVGAVGAVTLAFIMSTNRLLLDAASPPKDE